MLNNYLLLITQTLNRMTSRDPKKLTFSGKSWDLLLRGRFMGWLRVGIIDTLFLVVEWDWGHCLRAYEADLIRMNRHP
jgi:hypothetical protein